MSTLAVPSDMVATYGSTIHPTQRPTEAFDPSKRGCWRNGSTGGEEWRKAVLEAAETLGLTEALVNAAPTMEQVVRASSSDLSEQQQRALFDAATAAYTDYGIRYRYTIRRSTLNSTKR